ncbi:MAG: lysylphosphatidylglycerol synthase transmembrane domain-containing protein [Deltaproteobacteria bacterium]|nr:lysylphosphatidylglycerol synthase transmembrane domain-containing protein [Deltaproteobacteria bacterium]
MKHGKSLLRAFIGCVVSAFFIWLTLRGKDLGAIWESARSADYSYLVYYVGTLLLIHLLRVFRWGILLERLGAVRFSRLNRAGAIGAAALMTLPFRLGEFARPYLISDRGAPPGEGETPIRMSAALSTIVVERIMDGLTTSAVLIVSLLLTVGQSNETEQVTWLRYGALGIAAIFGGAGVTLLILLWQRERAVGLIRRIVALVSERLAERVVAILDGFLGGVAQFPRPARFLLFLVLTVVYWGVNGAGMVLLARGFGIYLTLEQGYAVLGVLVIGVMIPAGPGMVGTFQFFVLLGLGLFLPAEQVAESGMAYANVLWAAQFGQQVGLGLIFLLLKPGSVRAFVPEPEP